MYFRSLRGWVGEFGAARRGAARNPSKPSISPSCWRLPVCAAHDTGCYRNAATSCFFRSSSRLLVARRYSCLWVGIMGVRWCVTRATPSCGVCGAVRHRPLVLACSLCSLGRGGGGVVCTVFVSRRFVSWLLSFFLRSSARHAGCCRRVGVGLAFAGSVCPGGVSCCRVVDRSRRRGRARTPSARRRVCVSGGAVGLGSRRAASRVAACAVVICARAPLWSLGGL